MIIKVDLHLRASPLDEHRSLGVVAVEHAGLRLAPYQEIAYRAGSRHVKARVTSIRQRSDRLPHVYADELHADALAD